MLCKIAVVCLAFQAICDELGAQDERWQGRPERFRGATPLRISFTVVLRLVNGGIGHGLLD